MTTLKEHIIQCDERYKNLEHRLTSVENKIDELHHLVDSVKNAIISLAVRSAIAIVTSLCLAVWVIKF